MFFQIALLGAAVGLAYAVRDHLGTPFDTLFDDAGRRHGVPPNLLRAIARVESGFRASAVSPVNTNGSRDYGLMQISSSNFTRLGLDSRTALIPSYSVEASARLLAMIRRELGGRFSTYSWPMAYNVGSDLRPVQAGEAYAAKVVWHWQLYDLGRMLA